MKKIVMMMFAAMFTMNLLAENVKIKVTNMHCENCAKRVEKTLKTNEAVSQVKVDLECQTVCVSYDAEKTNVEALTKALIDAKFEVEIVKQCAKAMAKAKRKNMNAAVKAVENIRKKLRNNY